MAVWRTLNPERILMGRLSHGRDLLEEMTDICTREGVVLGSVEAVGAVSRARLGYYHQQAREYRYFTLNEPLEIASLSGNVSLRDGAGFVHAHAVFSDAEGRAYGGHLAPGTVIFACEFLIRVFGGALLSRQPDPATGLQLWEEGPEG